MKNNNYEYDVRYDADRKIFVLVVKFGNYPATTIPVIDIMLNVDVCGKEKNESK